MYIYDKDQIKLWRNNKNIENKPKNTGFWFDGVLKYE